MPASPSVRVKRHVRKGPYRRPTTQTTLSRPGGLRMVKGPGKFEGELLVSELLYDEALGWGSGDEIGDVQDFGHYQRIDADAELAGDLDKRYGLTGEELAFMRKQVGAIIHTDNSGFVRVEWFESKKAFDRIWGKLEDDYEKFMEGSEEY